MKKCGALILALVMLLSLWGCSGAPTWQEQYDLGVRYLSEGNYQEAIIAFTAAIEIDPKRAEAYVGRGGAYVASGETEENLKAALADYEAALELDEALTDAWLGLADVYIQQGDYDQSLEVLREALEKTGNDQSIADKLAEMESGIFTDSAGNVRRMEYRDGEGTLLWWHDYIYNDDGKESEVIAYDAAGNKIDQWEGYEYDDQGRVVRSVGYSFDTGEFTTVSEYVYRDGYLTESRQFSMNGTFAGSQQYEYDSQGNRVKTIGYGSSGEMSYYWIHTYDDQGNEIRVDYYFADGVTYGYDERTYDASGEQTGFYQYDQDGNLTGCVED